MYMSSPVFADGLIYGHSIRNKGQFVALDPATGVAKWTTSGRTADHASLLLTPAHLVFLTSDGKMIVARRNAAEFTVEKEYDVAAASTYASPVLLGADLIVRDATSVRKLSGQ
jgi:outer membrane protein assembly factor BamB